SGPPTAAGADDRAALLEHGRYLAQIGACAACHTPPAVPEQPPTATDAAGIARERKFRTDPDWVKYLDQTKPLAGGVPFILRLPGHLTGRSEERRVGKECGWGGVHE